MGRESRAEGRADRGSDRVGRGVLAGLAIESVIIKFSENQVQEINKEFFSSCLHTCDVRPRRGEARRGEARRGEARRRKITAID